MNQRKRFPAAFGAALIALSIGSGAAGAAPFPDVKGHWSSDTVEWGVKIGAINGYPDGTFRPNGQVTEAEFLAMLLKAYDPDGLQEPVEQKIWSDRYYWFADQYNYPTAGSGSPAVRDQPILRENVAEILAGAMGYHYEEEDAIRFLLSKQISLGKVAGELSVESFKGKDTLTRAEAVQFIRNMMDRGVTELKFRPLAPSPVEDLLELLPEETIALAGIEAVLKREVLPEYDGYTAANNNTDTVHLTDGQGNRAAAIVYDAVDEKRIKQVWVEDTRKDEYISLAADVLRAFGIPVGKGFADAIRQADEENQTIELSAGEKKLTIQPSERLRYIVAVHVE